MLYASIREPIIKSVFECTQLHNFMQDFDPIGPKSCIQSWTLCTKQTMQNAHSYCLNTEKAGWSQMFVNMPC